MKYYDHSKVSFALVSLLMIGLLAISLKGFHAQANPVVSARYVNAIQTKQAKSIAAGVRLGRLTPKEARKLRKEQHTIIVVERDMREDGSLDALELRELFEKLQQAQAHINSLSRNAISTHGTDSHGNVSVAGGF